MLAKVRVRQCVIRSLQIFVAAFVLMPGKACRREVKPGRVSEIATVSGDVPGSVVLWKYAGREEGFVPIFEQECENAGNNNAIATGDLDGDGIDEMVVSFSEGGAHLVGRNGQGELVSKKLGQYENKYGRANMNQISNSGLIDEEDGKTVVFSNGNKKDMYLYGTEESVYHDAFYWPVAKSMLLDIDGDGTKELLSMNVAAFTVMEKENGTYRVSEVLTLNKPGLRADVLPKWEKSLRDKGYDGDIYRVLWRDSLNQDFDVGDVLGDGSLCVVSTVFQGRFQVLRRTRSGWENVHTSLEVCGDQKLPPPIRYYDCPASCVVADVNNDGKDEIIIGSSKIQVFGNYDGSAFHKLWEGDHFPPGRKNFSRGVCGLSVADVDGDGQNELICGEMQDFSKNKAADGKGDNIINYRLAVMKNRGKESVDLRPVWQSERILKEKVTIAAGNFEGE